MRENALLLVELQVPSPSPVTGLGTAGDETLKKVRATRRGITESKLVAHCRLIAVISGSDGRALVLSAPSTVFDGVGCVAVTSAFVEGEETPARLSAPLRLRLLLTLLLPVVLLAAGGFLIAAATEGFARDLWVDTAGCTNSCGAGAGARGFTGVIGDEGRALAGKRALLVARRRLGNKVGVSTYFSMVSRRNL